MTAFYSEVDADEYLLSPKELYKITSKADIPKDVVVGMSETILRDYLSLQIDSRLKIIPAITFDEKSMYCGLFDTAYIYNTGRDGKLFFKATDVLSYLAN